MTTTQPSTKPSTVPTVPTVPNRAPGTLPATVPAALKGGHGNGRSSNNRRTHPFGGGIARRVHAELCRRCRQPILVGLDDEHCAATARVDPYPLNAIGEANALIHERPTYDLQWIGGRYVLDRRDHWQIAAHPAGTEPHREVLAQHACEYATPDHMRATTRPPRETTKHESDEPPF